MMSRPFAPDTGLPRGPDHYWRLMRQAGDAGFTIADIVGCSNGAPVPQMKRHVRDLERIGAVEKIGTRRARAGKAQANVYKVAVATRHAPVIRRESYTGVRGRIQENVWTWLRTGEPMTIEYLAFAASTAELPVKARTVETYVRRLRKAGLVEAVRTYAKGVKGRLPGARSGLYRLKLSANSGPKPLKIIDGRVFDPNRNAIVGSPIEGEVSA